MTQSELIAELVRVLEHAVTRLRPFANCCFNDNGDFTVYKNAVSYDDFVQAYFEARAINRYLSHAHAAQSDEWQPIETAPKDGTSLLLSNDPDEDPWVGHYCIDANRYLCYGRDPFVAPTHWRPLPSPPFKQEGK